MKPIVLGKKLSKIHRKNAFKKKEAEEFIEMMIKKYMKMKEECDDNSFMFWEKVVKKYKLDRSLLWTARTSKFTGKTEIFEDGKFYEADK